jgi:hypothetical protein
VEMLLMSSLYWVFLVPQKIKRKIIEKLQYLSKRMLGLV